MPPQQERSNMRFRPEQIAGWIDSGEEWRRIPEEPAYFVSNYGRVCNVDRVLHTGQLRRGRIIRPAVSKATGHQQIVIGTGNRFRMMLHALVLHVFIGPKQPGHEGLHWDDDPANNRLTNLRWGTRSENNLDAVRNGGKAIGEDIPHSKLTEDAVRIIRANPQASHTSLGVRFGCSAAAVKQVRDGITWKHVA